MASRILTDAKIRKVARKDKSYRISDGEGLYLEVPPTGGPYWRAKYRYDGREKRMAYGTYPQVSLAEARELHAETKRLLAQGIDPNAQKRLARQRGLQEARDSFDAVATEWLGKQNTWAPSHAKRVIAQLERDAFPWLKGLPVATLSAQQLLQVLQRVAQRGTIESAHRLAYKLNQIMHYAVLSGRTNSNPASGLSKALPKTKGRHHAAITDPAKAGALLRSIDAYRGSRLTELALKLAPLVFVRPGELRQAEWSEINFEAKQWLIPEHKIKQRRELIVPLSRQSVEILKELQLYSGDGKYVFPSVRSADRPMSDNTILSALRNLGYSSDEMSGHGFRAMARTLLAEELGYPAEAIEHQLSHSVPDPNGRAYNRAQFIRVRTEMMQRWADYLDELKESVAPSMLVTVRHIARTSFVD